VKPTVAALLGVLIAGTVVARQAVAFPLESAPLEATPRTWAFTIVPVIRYWRTSPSGNMTITAGGRTGSGSQIDLSSDLGLSTANAVEGGVAAYFGDHRIAIRYDPTSFHGDASLDHPITYHGTIYPAGARVSSDVSLNFVIPQYDYRLWSAGNTDLRAGVRGYVWTLDSELDGSSAGGNLQESRRFTHFLPAGLIALEGGWGDLRLGGSLSGGLLASDRYVADLEAGVGWCLLDERLRVDLGYRWLYFGFHETTNVGTLNADGLLVSLSAKFSL
jgi:hypothetical protein